MSVTLTEPQTSFLKKEARRLGLSVADLIRRIVDSHRGESGRKSNEKHS